MKCSHKINKVHKACYTCKQNKRYNEDKKFRKHKLKQQRVKDKEWSGSFKLLLRALKETTPCKDCKKFFPHFIMQFDHARGTKLFWVSGGRVRKSVSSLNAEIDKCDIVCANCHCKRTYTRNPT